MTKHNNLACLLDRRLIEVKGEDASAFLQGLITTDMARLGEGAMMAGALLTPQGKILFDFLVGKKQDSFFLDTPDVVADSLLKRLSLYKLRSNVDIILHAPVVAMIGYHLLEQFSDQVCSGFRTKNCGENKQLRRRLNDSIKSHSALETPAQLIFTDDRLCVEHPVIRLYVPASEISPFRKEWDRLRIAQAIAESGMDFALGEVFPHDINLDQIGGLSFNKGCYIGQEVVSRMQHRGTARRRLLLAQAQQHLPASGSVIEAGGKPIGTLGSSLEGRGLALVRLDRAKNALDKGQVMSAEGVEITLIFPERVNFTYPEL